MLEGRLSLQYLKEYCKFIQAHFLEELAKLELQRNREVNLPLLQQFKHLSDNELLDLSKESLTSYLQSIIEDRVVESVKLANENWKRNQLKLVNRDEITANDIVLLYNTRKRSLVTLLKKYTQDPEVIIAIINELEDYYAFQENLAMHTFAEIKQTQLKESEKRLKEAQEIGQMGNWEYNVQTGEVYWSDYLYSIFGFIKEDFSAGAPREAFIKRLKGIDYHEFYKKIELIADTDEKFTHEYTITIPNGESRIIWEEGYAERNEKEEVIIKGISQDITQRKKAEEQLRQREKFIAHITEANPDTIYVYDLENKKYLYLNQDLWEMYAEDKSSTATTQEKVVATVIHPEDISIIQKRHEKYQRTADGEILEDEVRVKSKDGTWRWLNTRGMVFKRNEDGSVCHVIGTARDVTKEKQIQLELRKINEELNERNEQLSVVQEELQSSNEELSRMNSHLEERVEERTRELALQREHLLSILMQAPAAIAILKGPELTFELTSPLYNELVGKKDLIGKPGREAIPELIDQGIWDLLEDVFKTGKTHSATEFPASLVRNGEREQCYFNFVVTPLIDDYRTIEGIIIHAVDVTKQVLALQESKENAEKVQLVLESIPSMAWTASPDGLVNYFNKRWYDFTGQLPEEAMNNGWENVLHPEDVQEAHAIWNVSIHQNTPVEMEHRFRNAKDGEYHYHIVRGVPLKNQEGEVLMWVGTCTNIHELKKATSVLQENEEQLRLITNNIPAFVSYIDKDQRYVFANKYYRNLGFVKGEIEGKSIMEVLGENYEASRPNIEKVLRGEEVTFETALVLKDGLEKKVEVKYVPNTDKDGIFRGFVVLGVDMTERIEIEKTLAQKNAALTKINADLDTFVYTASHDLKAPVSNIEGLICDLQEIIEAQNKEDEEINNVIGMVHTSITRFKNTIQNLTEVSKIQNNIADDIKEVNIIDVIENVKILIKDLIESNHAKINITPNFSYTLYFSEKNIQSVIFNLLTNAIKYRSSERDPVIDINFCEYEDEICLQVKDNGLGIAPNHFTNIFKMFRRAHHHVEGSGVGLYLVKRIIENAGGRIELESEVGVGTTFHIYLPKSVLKPELSLV